MPIRKPQLRDLEEGDVIFLDTKPIGLCCMAVLERDHSKLVLSAAASCVEEIIPIRSPQWGEYLTVDEEGNVCDVNGNDLTRRFLYGEVLIGRAMDVAKKYRSRIMPNMKLLQNGVVRFDLAPERKEEILRTIMKVHHMVFNKDYGNNHALLFEMFTRLVKGTPPQELPIYLSSLVNTLDIFSQIQGVLRMFEPLTDEVNLGKEAADLLDRVSDGKFS